MEITIEIYNQILPADIFRTVVTKIQRFHEPMEALLMFVACKDDYDNGWSVYAGKPNQGPGQIQLWGDKVHSEDIIRNICPCTDEVFKLYRH